MDQLKSILKGIFFGLNDSICGIFAIRFLNNSDNAGDDQRRRRRNNINAIQKLIQSCLLNGGIFGLSLILFDSVMLPGIYSILSLIVGSHLLTSLWYWMKPTLSYTFSALWRFPVFALTRVVNALWCQDIADSTYRGRSQFEKNIAKQIADMLFSLIIQALFLIQSFIIASVPFPLIGQFASLFHLSLLYSLYSFEYKWFNMGWELHRRLQCIENNWPYFFGFGFPLAVLTSLSDSYFFSGCIFSLLFPLFIISGNEAKPKRGSFDCPLKIFQLVVWFSNKLFHSTVYFTGSNQGKTVINKYKNR